MGETASLVGDSDGGDGGESNSPSRRCPAEMYYRLSQLLCVGRCAAAGEITLAQVEFA